MDVDKVLTSPEELEPPSREDRGDLVQAIYCAKTPDARLNYQDAQAIADAVVAAGYRKQKPK